MKEREGEETRWDGGDVVEGRRRLMRVEELQVFFLMKEEEEHQFFFSGIKKKFVKNPLVYCILSCK